MPQPPIISINVTYPGSLLNPSYGDVTLLSNSAFGLGVFDAWCADRDISLDLVSQGGGSYASGTLQASVYSTYELGILGAAIPSIENPGNLDRVNWLLNQNFSVNGYTMGEVQGAIWLLLGDDYASSTIIYPRDPAKITQLVNLANQHNGYVPDITDSDPTNDKIAVMLFPHKADGTAQQPLLMQVQSAALGDRVWSDSNGNGAQEVGESGVQGVTVNLWRDLNDNSTVDANELLASTITDASGYYQFVGLTPGLQYQLQFMQPSGYSGFTLEDAAGDTDDSDVNGYGITSAITLAPGQFNTSIDAGLIAVQPAHLGDTIWEDSNANGQQDAGEAGIAGVTVQLKDAGGNVIASTSTDANGVYGFDVLPGTYSVAVTPPAGYSITPTNQGNDLSDSDIDGGGMTGQYTLASGETNNSVDGGLYRRAELGDRVWLDTDGDGQQDAGEAGVANVTVNLKDALGNVIATQTTGTNGEYLFTDLTPGTYSVAFVAPAGYEYTQKDQGADASDSDADTVTGATIQTVLDSNESDRTWDAGLVQRAHLGDRIWEDTNANGQQDAGEAGIAGVTVQLKDAGGNVIASTSTDANGVYGFDVLPGTYSVAVTPPAGYSITPTNQGNDLSDSDIDGGGMTGQYTLASGETNNSVDGGLYRKAELGDRVWLDTDGDGQQDAGEAGVANVTVNLKDALGNVIATQTTGTNGEYLFTDLTPGTYSVAFVAPAGYEYTQKDQGADASDSDADTVTGATIQTVLDSNESDRTWDAGLVQLAHLGDRIWLDKNANGVQDSSETGLAGVTVNLLNASGAVVGSATTDASGNYLFSNLMPGDYAIQVVAPAGYTITGRDLGGNDVLDSDIDAVTGKTINTTLVSGENDLSWDAGLYQKAAIGDKVWLDANANGVQDSGEAGVRDVLVKLYDAGGNVVATQSTNAGGEYLFTALTPGDYRVGFDLATVPAGYSVTTQDAAGSTDANDSDANVLTGLAPYTTLESGETDRSWDMGLQADVGIDIEKYVRGRYTDETGGGEGLTPGFWKTHSAFGPAPLSGWPETGYSPDDSYEAIFGVNIAGSNPTLLEALGMNGGGAEALMRHSAAALLNAANPYVDYQYSLTQVIAMTQGAFSSGVYEATKDLFAVQNELGADLTTPAGGGTVVETPWYDADTATGPYIPVGGQAEFKYVVTNTGDVALSNVQVSDDRIPSLTFVGGDSDNDGMLDTNETWTYSASETVGAGVNYVNIGTVTGVDVASGRIATDSDAAHYTTTTLTSSLGDRVWLDSNGNGVQDMGEAGVAGVTVKLLNSLGAVIATQATDANGNYLFNSIAPGAYAVQVVAPSGYTVTGKDLGGNNATDSDIDPLTGKSVTTTINAGEVDLSWDAGLYQKASIGDKVWLDGNKNGIQDAGEAGMNGVTVNLLNSAGTVVATATTNTSGNYLFNNLAPGDYAIKVVAPAGYSFSAKDQGTNDALDSDVDTVTGKTVLTTLVSGENDLSWDAGLYQSKARIGDTVWEDRNYNGIQDAGEAGIGNVTVKLLSSAGTVLQTKTTDSNGKYFFDVDAGSYKVQVVKPSGYFTTKQNQGGNDGIDSDINSSGVTGIYTVTTGQQNLTLDAGLYKKASVGDKVWDDMNHNNLQDAGEPGISGIKVTLKTSAGSTVASSTTDSNGNYNFANLNPGDYTLVFDKTNVMHYNYGAWYNMSTWKWAVKDVGSNDAIDSDVKGDATATTNVTQTSVFNLESGENDMSWDAGITPIAIDLDGDGIQTLSRANAGGAFDLLGTGKAIQSGWLSGEDGFLAMDRNGNGRVDDISELFGGNNKGDGYAKLAAFDSNGDGVVDADDAAFADLRVWKDADGNHQTDAGELLTLDEAGVASLSLAYQALPLMDGNGNLHLERGSATMADGSTVDMTDVYFGIAAADVTDAGIELPSLADLMSDSRSLDVFLGAAEPTTLANYMAAAANDAFAGSALEAMKQLADLVDQAAYA